MEITMQRKLAVPFPSFSFRSRRRPADVLAVLRRGLRRWQIHVRLEAITASLLTDLKLNPFLFQIESSH
jgi:hypothetical protein